MTKKYILTFDQGTTSSRAILFNKRGEVVALEQKEFTQIFPKPGWVEHDPKEIFSSQISVGVEIIKKINDPLEISGIGITNQRETTIVWNKETGEPIYNAIVWQDRRTSDYCDELIEKGWADKVRQKTGLVIDPYFSATKIKWIFENIEGTRVLAEKGKLAFGTVDSWLIWKLTNGSKHITDITNASRTMLFNINTLKWDEELLELMNIPKSILPEVCSSSEVYGNAIFNEIDCELPIAGIAGDQQAALFGQQCIKKGMVKNTYGTGNFIVMNTGEKPILSKNMLLSTIAWKLNGKVTYALEGSVFVAGAAVQWLRDGLGIIKNASEIEALAKKVDDCGDVYFVPALTGLGAPHWDANARGTIVGITRGTNRSHIARAALEAICYQSYEVLKAMEADSGISIPELRVDGGATVNNLLMQYQSDILGIPVVRPKMNETTALGVAYFAGLALGFWKSIDEIRDIWKQESEFLPSIVKGIINSRITRWNKAVDRSKEWED